VITLLLIVSAVSQWGFLIAFIEENVSGSILQNNSYLLAGFASFL
jgi:hypothetical protein